MMMNVVMGQVKGLGHLGKSFQCELSGGPCWLTHSGTGSSRNADAVYGVITDRVSALSSKTEVISPIMGNCRFIGVV